MSFDEMMNTEGRTDGRTNEQKTDDRHTSITIAHLEQIISGGLKKKTN